MKITCRADKDIRLINNKKFPNLLASASITLDGEFVVRGLSVMNGSKGTFVNFPSEPYQKDGETAYRNTAFPLNTSLRDTITSIVFAAYEQAKGLNKNTEQNNTTNRSEAPAAEQDDEEEFENF